jgi:hypothetical protein
VISDSDGGAPEAKITGRALVVADVVRAACPDPWWAGDLPASAMVFAVQITLITVIEWDLDRAQLTATTWSPDSGARVRHRSYPSDPSGCGIARRGSILIPVGAARREQGSAAVTSIQPELWVDRGAAAVAYYQAAFGAKVLHSVGDGEDIVAQLAVGDAVFWVAATGSGGERLVPRGRRRDRTHASHRRGPRHDVCSCRCGRCCGSVRGGC